MDAPGAAFPWPTVPGSVKVQKMSDAPRRKTASLDSSCRAAAGTGRLVNASRREIRGAAIGCYCGQPKMSTPPQYTAAFNARLSRAAVRGAKPQTLA